MMSYANKYAVLVKLIGNFKPADLAQGVYSTILNRFQAAVV